MVRLAMMLAYVFYPLPLPPFSGGSIRLAKVAVVPQQVVILLVMGVSRQLGNGGLGTVGRDDGSSGDDGWICRHGDSVAGGGLHAA